MELFIDTALIDEIKEAWSWGILDGVTTNPTHIAASGKKFLEVIEEICQIVDGPVSADINVVEYICFDTDNDGFGDPGHPENMCPEDNCPEDYNPGQEDYDQDGVLDTIDSWAKYDQIVDLTEHEEIIER